MTADQNSADAITEPEEADTIELWISPEDRLLLDHAARESLDQPSPGPAALYSNVDVPAAPAIPPDRGSAGPGLMAVSARRPGRFGKWTRTRSAWQKLRQKPRGVSTAIDLAIVITLIGLAYLMQYWLATPGGPPPLARRLTAAQVARPAGSADPAQTQAQVPPEESLPVYFRNPFDSSEVFEFPPGTSQSEARDAVADLLLKRARERLSSLDRLRETRPPHVQGTPAMTAQNSADPPE